MSSGKQAGALDPSLVPRHVWQTTALNPAPATDKREAVLDGSSAEQARRDLYFQEKMSAEKLAYSADKRSPQARLKGMSRAEVLEFGYKRASGPAKGVLAELRRIDPSGERQVSATVEKMTHVLGWRLEHVGVTIGTVIHGPNLSHPEHLTDAEIDAMYAVLLERKVIFFRDQDLSHAAQRDFGKRFGSLEVFPFAKPPIEDYPEILPIMSGPGSPPGASIWHSDVTWRKSPSLGSMLYCEVAPTFGGETGFADTYATLQVIHDELRSSPPYDFVSTAS